MKPHVRTSSVRPLPRRPVVFDEIGHARWLSWTCARTRSWWIAVVRDPQRSKFYTLHDRTAKAARRGLRLTHCKRFNLAMVRGLLPVGPIMGDIKMRTTRTTAFALLLLAPLAGACSKPRRRRRRHPAASPAASSAPAGQRRLAPSRRTAAPHSPALPRAVRKQAPASAGAATRDRLLPLRSRPC